MRIGKKVRQAREEIHMSQRELAGNKLSQALISQIENGKMPPSIRSLAIIAHRLHKPLSYFVCELNNEHFQIAQLINVIDYLFNECQYSQVIEVGNGTLNLMKQKCLDKEALSVKLKIGQALYRLGKLPQAISVFEDIYENAVNYVNVHQIINSTFWLANCYYRSGQYLFAYKKYERVIQKAEGLKTVRDTYYRAVLYMASSAFRLGDYRNAIKNYELLYFSSDINVHPHLRIEAGMSLSWTYYMENNIDTAISVSREIRSLSLKNNEHALPKIKHNLGIYLYAKGYEDSAMELWQSALYFFENNNQQIEQAVVREDIAKFYLDRNNLNGAEACIQKALDTLSSIPKVSLRARLCRIYGQIEQRRKNLDSASRWYRFALESFQMSQETQEISKTMNLIRTVPQTN